MMKLLGLLALFFALGLAPASASAVTFSFGCITNNDPLSCAIGEAQVMMDVNDIGGGEVEFIFTNVGPDISTIARIYFDDGALSELATIINSPGVVFSQEPPGPMDLPGGGTVSPVFVADKEFNTGAESPPPLNGVGIDVGEFVDLHFGLMGGKTYADLLGDLDSGVLRVGVHVINFANGQSESLIAPEPSSLLLLGLGLGAAAFARRRLQP